MTHEPHDLARSNLEADVVEPSLRREATALIEHLCGGVRCDNLASPGREALRAVVEPAESDYLYFVARGDGTHEFSKVYREHVNAVKRYQLRRRKR